MSDREYNDGANVWKSKPVEKFIRGRWLLTPRGRVGMVCAVYANGLSVSWQGSKGVYKLDMCTWESLHGSRIFETPEELRKVLRSAK